LKLSITWLASAVVPFVRVWNVGHAACAVLVNMATASTTIVLETVLFVTFFLRELAIARSPRTSEKDRVFPPNRRRSSQYVPNDPGDWIAPTLGKVHHRCKSTNSANHSESDKAVLGHGQSYSSQTNIKKSGYAQVWFVFEIEVSPNRGVRMKSHAQSN